MRWWLALVAVILLPTAAGTQPGIPLQPYHFYAYDAQNGTAASLFEHPQLMGADCCPIRATTFEGSRFAAIHVTTGKVSALYSAQPGASPALIPLPVDVNGLIPDRRPEHAFAIELDGSRLHYLVHDNFNENRRAAEYSITRRTHTNISVDEPLPYNVILEDGLLAWGTDDVQDPAFFVFDLGAREWIWRNKTQPPVPPGTLHLRLQAVSHEGVLLYDLDRFYFVPFDGPTVQFVRPDVSPDSVMLDGSTLYWITSDDKGQGHTLHWLRHDAPRVEDLAPIDMQVTYPLVIDQGRVLAAEFYDPDPSTGRIIPVGGLLAFALAVVAALLAVRARKA